MVVILFDGDDEPEDSQSVDVPDQDLNDSDIDADVSYQHGPRTSSEKRKAQNAIFKAWASKKAEEITAKEVKDAIQGADDETLSITDILAKQESSARITNPRDYQNELFQKAKEENIIAVLDTGSGKTHIATLLLRHFIDEELERRAAEAPPKISFFLVDSVNLVFQQANVLRCGLDHDVEGICGAMSAQLWSQKAWDKRFTNNMVIVCTAEVLVQCLMHSFINIHQINLLIFDEAHHAKKNHSYARIIKDFYLVQTDPSKRPRIFGMTASPVDAKVDIQQAARDLEKLLHCKIATTSDLSLIRNNISRPSEDVVEYDRLLTPFETLLHQELKARFGDVSPFEKLFQESKKISAELGRWASDMFWSFSLTEEQARKIEMREERKFHAQKEGNPIAKLDAQIARLREATQVIKDFSFSTPEANSRDLSSKVLVLHKWLQLYFSRQSDARCIVFVERRSTARLLHLIFGYLGGAHLKSGVLMGVNSSVGDLTVTLRKQVLAVANFRKGDLNCIFATSVAEEGLDIPQCNLIVRFDLYRTMISYVQSRGRARHRNSKYLHMVEKGNPMHTQAVLEARRSEKLMRQFCQSLPADRLLLGNDIDFENDMVKERDFRTFTDPSTGAKLTYGSSLAVLAHFISSLPQGNEIPLQPNYIMSIEAGKFVCEVILPDNSPISSAIGRPASKKSVAKCSAAFEACILLRKGKYLDGNLLPIYTKQLPVMRNALLALDMKKKNFYRMRIKPSVWEYGRGDLPTALYLTILDVTNGLERPYQPMGLLTRVPLPQMPRFPVYLREGKITEVKSMSFGSGFDVSGDMIEHLTTLTLRAYKDIFAKTYEHDPTKMSYWFAPLRDPKTVVMEGYESPADFINWSVVQDVFETEEYKWTPDMKHEYLRYCFLVDKWDGGRRFFSVEVAPDMKATDPLPAHSEKHKKFNDSILDYSVSLWNKSRKNYSWDLSQPVVEAERVPFRRNLLAPAEEKEHDDKIRCFVCPEPLRISALPAPFVAMCYVFPAIIHRFESYLIAVETCEFLGLDIGPGLALEALTKDSDNSDENGEEKINFRSGMGPNYERLEFMGDCFLKMATSISIFVQNPDDNEFEFHVKRMCLLCNKNLFKTAINLKLYEYIRSMAFSRRTWYPEGLKMLEGKGSKKTGEEVIKHSLGDKSIADVCEAFIGAAFMEHNELGEYDPKKWDQAVKAVTIMVSSDDHTMETWADYLKAYSKPKYQVAEATASQLDLAAQIEKKHDYHFRYPRLLRSAFIHPSQSFMWEKIPHYQRLEFLGDSLLDMVFVMYLFYRYPNKDPQWLTEHKMPMVSNKFLGALCVKLNFHGHLRHNNAVLQHQIQEYVTGVQEAEIEADGSADYWTTVNEPPKCLADIVESYVGAIFVDSDFDFNEVQRFFDQHIKVFFEDMSIYDAFANNHPITRLTKLLNINLGCCDWRIATRLCESTIPGAHPTALAMVLIHWNVIADGSAVSGRHARIKASNAALDLLEGLPQYEFRRRFGCDCVNEELENTEDGEEKIKEAVGGLVI